MTRYELVPAGKLSPAEQYMDTLRKAAINLPRPKGAKASRTYRGQGNREMSRRKAQIANGFLRP